MSGEKNKYLKYQAEYMLMTRPFVEVYQREPTPDKVSANIYEEFKRRNREHPMFGKLDPTQEYDEVSIEQFTPWDRQQWLGWYYDKLNAHRHALRRSGLTEEEWALCRVKYSAPRIVHAEPTQASVAVVTEEQAVEPATQNELDVTTFVKLEPVFGETAKLFITRLKPGVWYIWPDRFRPERARGAAREAGCKITTRYHAGTFVVMRLE